MARDQFRVLQGGSSAPSAVAALVDPVAFQRMCLEAYEASQVARGFSPVTMDNWNATLERFLAACAGRRGRSLVRMWIG
ncbi:MAG TPA: hypothetical protein VHH53_02505 [Pseudonocardiaceae bacterium]|nr:hypothetical protein [Pseudonocardiaceae bacterium]